MKKFFPHIIFLLLLGGVIFIYSLSNRKNSSRVINKLKVEFVKGDQNYLTYKMIEKFLVQNGSSVLRQPKSSVDLFSLEQFMLNNPFVEDAVIYLTPRGVLKTIIKQRTPLVRVLGKKSTFYIDKYEVKMPISLNYSARVPIAMNLKTEQDVKKVKDLLLYVNRDDFLIKEVVGIKRMSNDFYLTVRSGNYLINLGDIVNLDLKFNKLKAFYNKMLKKGSLKKYSVISLKYDKQVVCLKQVKNG